MTNNVVNIEMHFKVAECYRQIGNIEMCVEECNNIIRLNPGFSKAEKMRNECQEVPTRIINGNDYKNKADWQNAIVSFTKAIELQPQIGLLYLKRAECHFLMEDFKSTLFDARKSRELDRFLIDGYICEVKCLFILSNY